MAHLQKIDAEIEALTSEIGLSVDVLKQVLRRDDRYIEELVNQGHPLDVAERASLIGGLRNIINLMISHKFTAKTAARVLSQTPEEPFNFSSTDEEKEKEEEQQQTEEDGVPNPGRSNSRPNFIRPDISSSSSSTSNQAGSSITCKSGHSSSSISSSDDEVLEAKRIKLDPDYNPSTTSEDVTTSAATTASSSSVTSEAEEEQTETETDSYVQSGTTEDEEHGLSEEVEEDK
jgi:hypothetical protein